ncbi:hypothetical protein D4S03_04180 [bacterium]|nr:MAG: hypothetical protein D4S03_04180 [bacterium]
MESKLFGSLEQQIIDVLWRANKPLKPVEVLKRLKGNYAYTTIMTVLKRMSDKKVLSRKLVGVAYIYSPVCNKENYIKKSLNSLYGNLVDTYGDLAISQFVDIVKKDKGDMNLLKQFVDSQKKSK